jgi:hypothetical protein
VSASTRGPAGSASTASGGNPAAAVAGSRDAQQPSGPAMSELDDVVDDLYSGPPSEFVARRTAAVKAARAAKDRELATAIADLRKPTVSAWLVNLLMRDDPDLAGQIVALGEGMREAERSLDGPALRELTSQRRALIRSLVGKARHLARPTGQTVGDAAVQELDATLTAALADATVAREVVSGRLTGPREHVGFGGADLVEASPAPRPTPRSADAATGERHLRLVEREEQTTPKKGGESAAAQERRRRREEREQRARDEAQAAWEQAQRTETEARDKHESAVQARDESADEVARAQERATQAHADEDDLVRQLAEVRDRLAAAGKAANVADKALATAQQTLRADDKVVAAAERELNRAEEARRAAEAVRERAAPDAG